MAKKNSTPSDAPASEVLVKLAAFYKVKGDFYLVTSVEDSQMAYLVDPAHCQYSASPQMVSIDHLIAIPLSPDVSDIVRYVEEKS